MLSNLIQSVDRRLGYRLSSLRRRYWQFRREVIEPKIGLYQLRQERLQRLRKYRGAGFRIQDHKAVVQELNTNGFTILRNAFDKQVILDIKQALETHLQANTCVSAASKDSARKPGDLAASSVYLTEEEMARGQEYYRQHTNYVMIDNPVHSCPCIAPVAFSDLAIDITAGYLGALPAIGGFNLRKSFANGLPEFDTLYFHSDTNAWKFLKFFFYLNDVDEQGGPFCFVKGSHTKKFKGWKQKYRWTYEEIAAIYGAENILNLTANVGDMIIADTTGFHRGTKVISRDRSMLTVDYLLHEELCGNASRKIRSEDYQRLSGKQRVVADFLEVVS